MEKHILYTHKKNNHVWSARENNQWEEVFAIVNNLVLFMTKALIRALHNLHIFSLLKNLNKW